MGSEFTSAPDSHVRQILPHSGSTLVSCSLQSDKRLIPLAWVNKLTPARNTPPLLEVGNLARVVVSELIPGLGHQTKTAVTVPALILKAIFLFAG